MWRGLDPFAAKREVSRMRRFNAGGVGPSAHRARRGSIAVIAIALSVAVIGIASVGSASAAPPSSAAAASAADGLTLEKVSDSGAVKSKRATFCRNVGYIYGSKNILQPPDQPPSFRRLRAARFAAFVLMIPTPSSRGGT